MSARNNGKKSFRASLLFVDPLAETFDDPGHSADERRFITIGESTQRRCIAANEALEPLENAEHLEPLIERGDRCGGYDGIDARSRTTADKNAEALE
jgi:hypothetical protein